MEKAKECVHHWIIGNTTKDGSARYTRETCKLCHGERYLVRDGNNGDSEGKYTEITYPEKKRRHHTKEYYLANKEEIIQDYRTIGWLETRKKWKMAGSTLTTLMTRWGVNKVQENEKWNGEVNALFTLVDQALAYETGREARAFWAGVKAAKGIG